VWATTSTRVALGIVPIAAVASLVMVAMLVPSDAEAGTASLRLTGAEGQQTAQLFYRAASGEKNRAEVFLDWSKDGVSRSPIAYVLDDRNLDAAGPGCVRVSAGNPSKLRCSIPENTRPLGPTLWLGDRDDFACVTVGLPGGSVTGGPGHDDVRSLGRLSGGPGDDILVGPNSEVDPCRIPGAGAIRDSPRWVSGGSGADFIEGGGTIFGGPGRDFIDALAAGSVVPGSGSDEVYASRGNQLIRARDSSPDVISCSGRRYHDTVLADGLDVSDSGQCEEWRRRGVARAVPVSLQGYYGPSAVLDRTLELLVVCPHDGPSLCKGRAAITVPGGRALAPVPFGVARGTSRWIDVRVPVQTRERFADRFNGELEGRDVKVTAWSRDRSGILRSAQIVLGLYLEQVGTGTE
jgi:hypothetical protein